MHTLFVISPGHYEQYFHVFVFQFQDLANLFGVNVTLVTTVIENTKIQFNNSPKCLISGHQFVHVVNGSE